MELAARDAEAQAHVAAARSWLAGRPSLEASYANDQPRTAVGLTELEYGVQLPLWRPGERRDAATQGRTLAEHAGAWRALLELTIAGRLRDSLASLESAERLLEIEQQAVVDTQQLVTSVERLFAAGEMAALDVTQARTSLLAQRRVALQAEAALANAEAALMRLTGLAARPAAAHREALSERKEIQPVHPWLHYLSTAVTVASDSVKRSRREALGNPTVTLGALRQRENERQNYHDSLTLSLSVPLGGSAHIGSQVSSAKRQKAEAEVALKTAQRELEQRLDETQREIDLTTQSLRLSAEQMTLDRRQWGMAKTAFELGEITLFQVLTAWRESRTSLREHELLTLRRESLAAQFNQIVGVLP